MPFGPHIVASEHDEWKRYRKVSAPAFTEVFQNRTLSTFHVEFVIIA